jgi:hypothetical protein
MEWLNSILTILTGLALRLAIPIVITLLAAYLLHKVDVHWQKEAVQAQESIAKVKCWEIKKCTAEQRRKCPSPNSAGPCWQEHRQVNGYLREECLDCQVFHQAPIPSFDHSQS